MSTFTTNLNLELVARGDLVGVWDTPENDNWSLVDAAVSGSVTVPLVGSTVTLSQSQYKNTFITLTGALTANVQVNVPAINRLYTFQNLTTNSSVYGVYITTGNPSPLNEVAGLPPNQVTDVVCDTFHVRYRNLPPVGSYMDLAGASVPIWILLCLTKPYLNCDGSAFSATDYPALAALLGGTTLPDSRGRFRATIEQGTGRITSGLTDGINGASVGNAGGFPWATLQTSMLPPYTPSGPVTLNNLSLNASFYDGITPGSNQLMPSFIAGAPGAITASGSWTFTGAPQGGVSNSFNIVPPAFMGGITLIRAA